VTPADPFMAGHEPRQRRPGDFRRTEQGTPQVSDPTGATTKHDGNKADLLALCAEVGIDTPDKVTVAQLHDMLGGRPKWVSYSRPSNFGKVIEDMYSIHKWDQRQQAYGFAVTPELVDRAGVLLTIEDRESKAWKDEADKIVKAAKLAAKASIAADRGTHTHELTEDDDEGRDIIARIEAGEQLGLDEAIQRALVGAWRNMLEVDGLEILATEATVVHDGYRAAGTLDRIARLTKTLRFRLITGEIVELAAGTVVVLDIKTGKRRLRDNGTVMYWHSYAVQVVIYVGGVPYDTETDTRGEWPWQIDQRWALIAHLDVLGAMDGAPRCDLILVDLEAGRHAADLCVAAKAWAARTDVFSVAQLDVEGDGVAGVNDTPSTAVVVGESGETSPTTTPDIARDRNQLALNPDQGADLSDREFELLWAKIRRNYDTLPPTERAWINEISSEATRRNLSFHTRRVQTERSYHIAKALITLATAGADDDIARELIALILGDVAFSPHVSVGWLVGSLDATQATRFSVTADLWATQPVSA